MDPTLADAMAAHSVKGLWQHFRSIITREPLRTDSAMHWSHDDLQALIERTVAGVDKEDSERRVLLLANPAIETDIRTVQTLVGGIQVLEPGERADPHRHSAAAIRFILAAEGGYTTVNKERCPMRTGDLILTPSWTWHGHVNDTADRITWFDALDVPLSCRSMNAHFFEASGNLAPRFDETQAGAGAVWDEAGLASGGGPATPYSPKVRFPWDAAQRALDAAVPRRDGSRQVRYVNPATGGAVMATIDCSLQRLPRGGQTTARRSTASAICVVAEGEGHSTVGAKAIAWRKGDVFTVPQWAWHSHHPDTEAQLFVASDREAMRRLDLLLEEEEG